MKPKSTIRLAFPLATAIAALLAVSHTQAATFYWDANGSTAGFGSATGGAWSEDNTSASSPGTGRWTTGIDGTVAGNATQATANTDVFNFGTATLGLTAGTINITATVNMGNTTYGAASGAIVLNGGTIAYSAAPTITVNNATNTINSIIGGAATSFTKAGAGTLVLTGANTFTGSTIINGGTIDLGGGTANGSLASTALTLGGGALNYTRTGTNAHTFTTTNVNAGASSVTATVATNTIDLGTVTRATGGALNFSSGGAGTVAALPASNDATGIMAGLNSGDTWAVANGAGVAISGLGGGSYTLSSVAGATSASYTGLNIDVDSSPGVLDGAITPNSLRFSSAAANTLDLTGFNHTLTSGAVLVGSTVGSNLITITGGTLAGAVSKDLSIIQNNTSGGLTISSVIGDNTAATALTKSGAGLLTLDNSNTFTGGVFLHAGRLVLGNAGALNSTTPSNVTFGSGSTGTLTLNGNNLTIPVLNSSGSSAGTSAVENANASNVTLTISSASNSNFSGVIQDGTGGGTLALTKSLGGTLTLSGPNTYSGGTSLSAGVVAISNATSFGAGAITVTGTSRINATGGITYANPIDVGTQTLTMQNPATVTSTATFSGILSGTGTVSLANSGANGVQGILAFTNTANAFTGNVVLSASGSGDEHFQFNSIGDGGNFTFAKNGNRQLITHTGSSNITFTTRQINIASTMTNINTRQGLDGGGGNPVSSFFNSGAGTLTFNANMGMTSLASDGVFYFNGTNNGNNTFAGIIGDPTTVGRLWIGKLGAGTWLLTGDNTYEGGTIVANGVLSVSKIENAANAQPLGIGTIIQFGVGNNGTSGNLVFTGSTNSTTDKQVVIGPMNQANGLGTGGIINNGSGTLTFSGAAFNPTISGNVVSGITTNAVTVARTLTIGGANTGANTISGTIQNNNGATGTVAITKADAGTWVLAGNNSYTGATTVNGGTLILSGANTTTGATAVPAGTLVLANTLAVQTSSGITLGGASAATLWLSTDAALTLPQIAGASGVGGSTIVSDRATAGAGLTHALGSPNLGANTFNFVSGPNVTSGTAGITFASMTMASGSAGATVLNPTTALLTIVGGVTSATNDVARTLELGGTGTGHSIGGVITQSVASALSLTKSNSSTWTLTGASTYSGATTVNDGALLVNSPGSLAAASAVTVNGGTFGGSGTVGGNVTVAAAGNLAPGASAGTLSITGNLDISAITAGAGKLKYELAALAGPNDLTAVTGTLTIGTLALADLEVTNLGSLQAGTYTLITSAGITGTVDGSVALISAGFNGQLQITGNNLELVVTAAGGTTYASWVSSFGLTGGDALAGADPDFDGIDNGAEMVLGGNPATGMDTALLPTIALVNADPDGDLTLTDYLLFTYRRTAVSEAALVAAACETDTDLVAPWTPAVNAVSGVVIQEDLNYLFFTPAAPADTDRVRVYVPRGANTKLFGRLNVVVP